MVVGLGKGRVGGADVGAAAGSGPSALVPCPHQPFCRVAYAAAQLGRQRRMAVGVAVEDGGGAREDKVAIRTFSGQGRFG